MIFEQQISAVNPTHLAEISGATKIRRFAAPLPPVIRPHLLTQQLRDSNCSCHGGMALPPDYGRLRGLRGGMYIFPEGLGFVLPDSFNDPSSFDMNALQVPSMGSGNVSLLQTVALGANFVPGVGQVASAVITTASTMLAKFQSWFGIGAGRHEADIIVPVQNDFIAALGHITDQIRTGQNPGANQLAALYREVWARAVTFQEFVLMRNFTDRRASGQALNTTMPYIDGSCGYAVPVGMTASPSEFNCLSWGDGTIGGVGTNGMLGAIARAIQEAGGDIPSLPDLHQSANRGIPITNPGSVLGGGVTGIGSGPVGATIMGVSTPLALVIGVVALFLWKRGLF